MTAADHIDHDPAEDGRAAWHDALDLDDNPYPEGSADAAAWRRGWQEEEEAAR